MAVANDLISKDPFYNYKVQFKTVERDFLSKEELQDLKEKEIAVKIERPKAFRVVASANGLNRISIIIPCHQVIGTDGKLTGYVGGLVRKRCLLDHENGKSSI